MRRLFVAAVSCLAWIDAPAASLPAYLASPDDRLQVVFQLTGNGEPRYRIELGGAPVLRESRLGLVRNDVDFTKSLELVSASTIETVREEYELLTSKRRRNTYTANRQVFHLESPGGDPMEIQFQVSNGGVAFRYRFPGNDTAMHRIESEGTSFRFPDDTKAWLQPVA
ncbi:MAG TPA: glycoside hydrolase family 97 N-terminal domain-containing protein, partial [Woeseiaceae bacterium]|nr:glycoside hydrolase family 97 N-terminal domain-containing protein [Woeseiaceae bacterium]